MPVDRGKFDSTRGYLLALIEDFLDETGVSHSRFSVMVTNSRSLVSKLRDGKDVTTGTYDRCVRAMDVFRARKMKVERKNAKQV